ncbi:MAG TPA: (2Fe-2S)-binding protein [Rhodocyclaceae bacterium]
MYVCVCNAVTESDIDNAVAAGCTTLRELRESLGVGTCCGRCSDCARRRLHQTATPATKRQRPVCQLAAA